MSVGTYKIIELVGSSAVSWEDAAKNAVETASKTLRRQSCRLQSKVTSILQIFGKGMIR